MSGTYIATGINLKSMPLGENDRLLTILTREFGLIQAVAPGARKHRSKLSGRSALFVVNQLLIAKGRNLDKITQAETLQSYPGLSKELSKLAGSQYMAEMVLCQALSEQPQEQLYDVLNEHLLRLEQLPSTTSGVPQAAVLAYLCHGVFHLLAVAGIAPQVHECCLTRLPLTPDFTNPDWRVGFSIDLGGAFSLAANTTESTLVESEKEKSIPVEPGKSLPKSTQVDLGCVGAVSTARAPADKVGVGAVSTARARVETPPKVNAKLNAVELALFQQLAGAKLTQLDTALLGAPGDLCQQPTVSPAWLSVEQILRQYTQYHLGRSIRSAALMDACFSGNGDNNTRN